ncbi:alanine racemase [Agrobacterium tumefaciens]|uniref:Y4yA family PLP-dependent enzyme n=1 Tax=Agrobacterium tumefaciens TaxID=358 RepID=A0AA44FBV2_AGRTU|nr:Y4yA family PLP-dependent enzyme [Agrobacterium tumefaciens]NTC32024.1 Y4yA family PLP-dependent enzyme [Agrobacterium tumefaciens]
MELAVPSLRALERQWAVQVRHDNGFLRQISHAVQGPFHLIHPESFAENLLAFQAVLKRHEVRGRVYFGKKANKAGAWLREIATLHGSVDVASEPEFVHALANGIKGERIGVTGAAKSDELLWLASRHNAIVAIDALDELGRAIAIAARSTTPLRILLRVLPPSAQDSRFGLNERDLGIALTKCAQAEQQIEMQGFSFHLDGYAVEPRAELALALVQTCLDARAMGLTASAISIGGGFACSFVSEEDWLAFKEGCRPELFHAAKTFSQFYPFFQSPTGAGMLDAILGSSCAAGNLAAELRNHQIELFLEPGRALLDGAGMSAFPVQGFKQNRDYGLVTVAGLSMSMSAQWVNSEFLPTPLLVQAGPERPQEPTRAAIGGSSCMEYDVLTWRKVAFEAPPRYGDLILYPNTAGYQMDKNESSFHQLPLPPKIVVSRQDNQFVWRIDQ